MREEEFALNSLFEICTTRGTDKNKIELVTDGSCDFIGRTRVNNGIQGTLCPLNYPPNKANTFSLIQVGESSALWRDRPWYASQNLFCLTPKDNNIQKQYLYFESVINKEMSRYGTDYNSYPTLKSLNDTHIVLPIQTDFAGNPILDPDCAYHPAGYVPDWFYMQERIAELEQERIAELEQYLIATGLNDYQLTDEDKAVLSLSRKATPDKTGDHADAGGKREEEFLIRDMFTSANGNVDIQKTDINDCGIHVVSSGVSNCGIIGKTDREAAVFPANTITVDMFGYAFYRDFDYKMVTHARVFTLLPKKNISALSQIYIVTQLSSLPKMYNYSNMCSWNKIQNMPISLPIQTDSAGSPVLDPDCTWHPAGYIPNWDYMEKYIRAVEKLVIANVVKWKDEEIKRTKEIVNASHL